MRYILTLDYDGSCECPGESVILPIVSEFSKETSLAMIKDLVIDKQEEIKQHTKAIRDWWDSSPVRTFYESHKVWSNSQKDKNAVFSAPIQDWLAKQPSFIPVKEEIYFGGQTISTYDLLSVDIQTVDEWFTFVEN